MKNQQTIGIIGAGLLFIGVFTPIVSLPIVGNINYFNNGKGDGAIVLALAALSFFLAVTCRLRGLLITGGGVIITMSFSFYRFHQKMDELQTSMNADLAGNPFRGLADAAVQGIQLQWGWAILVFGIVLVLTAALMKDGQQQNNTSGESKEYLSSTDHSTYQPTTTANVPIENLSNCPKCKHGLIHVDNAPQTECSKCGLIFHKYFAAQAARSEAAQKSRKN